VAGAPFNVLHVCKRRNLLFECGDYPVAACSWATNDPTNPTLREALGHLGPAVMGGISQDGALQAAGPGAVLAEYAAALAETAGRRWLAAPGCSIPPGTPAGNLRAVRDAVASTRLSMSQER
jgi:uroporphyrinogen-III decarboxylase